MLEIYRKFFRFSGDHARAWYVAIVLEFVQSIAVAIEIVPLFIVLQALVANTLTPDIAWLSFGIVAASVALRALLHYGSHKLEMQACYGMLDDKRISIGERMKYMPMGFFNDRSLGSLTAVCTSTMEDLESMAGATIVRILTGIIHAVVFSLGFMLVDWRIGLVFLAGIAVMLFVNSRMLAMSRRYSPERLATQMRLVDGVLEYIQGMSVVKAFNLAGTVDSSLERDIAEAEAQNFKLEKKAIPYTIAQQCVLRLFAVAAVALSIVFYLSGTMELFVCLLMVIGGFFVYSQIEAAGALSFMLPMVDASIDRVEEADATPYLDEHGTVEKVDDGSIEFAGVSFSYGARTVIDDVTLSIPARTSCAVVGPSGSGKTTLVNLMARFWDVDAGEVRVGGADVRAWKFDALMANFAMVFQDVYLFNDTIESNIKFGRPDATHEEVVAAARAARCHDFIEALPDGYDTMLGEGGATVSGGEKQRISIARALLKDAPIVLLDEATANVDPENEADLIAAIEALTARKTVVMIAHRLKTVRNADQILVVDEGRVVQRGTHDQLMEEGGMYEDFVRMRERSLGWKIDAA
ncbi:ABC transporter ATP-binding protein [Eggerthella sinensis]|uniref:ABC transporter ATP-binding protein n=1 Tax=Eggerthella sinensis TaxID=242230 RepID=UPI00248E03B3|nr:ABC transporter ATP-binding protein [Eggerthella sinensis]